MTAEQRATKCLERMNAKHGGNWVGIIVDAIREAVAEAVKPKPLPPFGMTHHHRSCKCDGMGGDR